MPRLAQIVAQDATQRLTGEFWPALRAGDISDEVLETFVTIGTYDTIARKLVDRFGSCITDCEFSIAVMLQSGKNEVLSTILYSFWQTGRPERAAAVAVSLMMCLCLLVGISSLLTSRKPDR